jgi:colanic acid biosynthesis protein WcaH
MSDPPHSTASRPDQEVFLTVIANTPLVSIDLVVRNDEGKVLVGRRNNEPARGTWFVPGGRIWKDETLDEAYHRIATVELGPGDWVRIDAQLMGAYTHRYPTNFAEVPGISTHYVVLAHLLDVDALSDLPVDQHSAYLWVDHADLDDPPDGGIHENTAVYLRELAR